MPDSATLWTVAYQASQSMGFPRQQYWNGLPFHFLGDLPDAGIKPASPALIGRFITTEPPGKIDVDNIDTLLNLFFFFLHFTFLASRIIYRT